MKLKGVGEVGSGVSKKKKKQKKPKEEEDKAAAVVEEDAIVAAGEAVAGEKAGEDRRTEAERRHDEAVAAREAERVARLAAQSHRDRVAAFNAHLATLSEHHDIPKVGPG